MNLNLKSIPPLNESDTSSWQVIPNGSSEPDETTESDDRGE